MRGSVLGSARDADHRPGRAGRTSATGNVVGVALIVTGAGLTVSGFVDLLERGANTGALFANGAIAAAIGLAMRRYLTMPARIPPRVALRSVMVAALAMIGVSSIAYLTTGAITDPVHALFESTAGFSTTSFTVLEDVGSVDQGILFWRATTQWLGGFFALATIVVVLPFLGVGGPQADGIAASVRGHRIFSPHVRRLLRAYFGLYLAFTAIGSALFLVGGMGPFDAVTYAFTTISTGGFANHGGSFTYFDSALIEWLGAVGMLLGGLSIPLAWRAIRGRTVSSLFSTELVAYGALIVGATLVLTATSDQSSGVHDALRTAAFTATSAVSTTGHWTGDWSTWAPGPQLLVLVLAGVGAMSGALGGGFRIVRALALMSYIGRELLRQLVPRSIRVVRVGGTTVAEETVDRMIGYQVLFIGTAAVGFFALALFGFDLVTALSGSISALSTFGPALGDLGPGTVLAASDLGTLVVLMVLMLAGRVELYPVLNALVRIMQSPARLVERWTRHRARGHQ